MPEDIQFRGLDNNNKDSQAEQAPKEGKRYLLMIGVGKYDHPGIKNLPNPVNDVTALEKVLMDEYDFNEKSIFTTEKDSLKPTRIAILDRIEEYTKMDLNASDFIMVYFAGHGVNNGNDGYWIPADGTDKSSSFISLGTVLSSLGNTNAQVMLVADCCFSGTLTDSAGWDFFFQQRLTGKKHHIFVITSGRSTDLVEDGKQGETSPFAAALIKSLKGLKDSNFLWLIYNLRENLDKNLYQEITKFTPPDSNQLPLKRKDPSAPKLRDAFLELNYDDQEGVLRRSVFNKFNLVYLNGTKRCGHQLFLHHFFKAFNEDVSIFSPPNCVLRLGTNEFNISEDLWAVLSKRYFDYPQRLAPERISLEICNALETNNFYIFLKLDLRSDNNESGNIIYDFWKELNEILKDENFKKPASENSFFLFVLDRRGGEGNLESERFKNVTIDDLSNIIFFPQISPLKKDITLSWHSQKKKYIGSDKFSCLPLSKFHESKFIEDAIMEICQHCESSIPYDDIFIKHWLK